MPCKTDGPSREHIIAKQLWNVLPAQQTTDYVPFSEDRVVKADPNRQSSRDGQQDRHCARYSRATSSRDAGFPIKVRIPHPGYKHRFECCQLTPARSAICSARLLIPSMHLRIIGKSAVSMSRTPNRKFDTLLR